MPLFSADIHFTAEDHELIVTKNMGSITILHKWENYVNMPNLIITNKGNALTNVSNLIQMQSDHLTLRFHTKYIQCNKKR